MKVVVSKHIWFEHDESGWALVIKKKDAEEHIPLDDMEARYLIFFTYVLAYEARFVALLMYQYLR